jgi:Tol biopolymer transport system component
LVASIAVAAVLTGCVGQGSGTETITEATPTTRNGEIAFARLDDQGRSGVFVVEADGTGLGELPATPLGESPDPSPAWSPDGESMAFGAAARGGDGGFELDIYVADADGGGLERVTTEPTFDSGPSWSPDGSRLAFSGVDTSRMFGSASASAGSDREGSDESGIHTIRSDGTGLHQLTTEPGDEYPA